MYNSSVVQKQSFVNMKLCFVYRKSIKIYQTNRGCHAESAAAPVIKKKERENQLVTLITMLKNWPDQVSTTVMIAMPGLTPVTKPVGLSDTLPLALKNRTSD